MYKIKPLGYPAALFFILNILSIPLIRFYDALICP